MTTVSGQRRGATIRAARRARGWTQRELARQSGVSNSSIQDLESDVYKRPHEQNLREVARVLDLDFADLMGVGGEGVDPGDSVRVAIMPRDVRVFLDMLGGWLTGLTPERREKEMKTLTSMVFGPSSG